MKLFLKIFGGIIGVVSLLLIAIVIFFSLPSVQRILKQKALEVISESLGTQVSLENASLSIFDGSVDLYELHINDQHGQSMLAIDTLSTQLDIYKVIKTSTIELTNIKIQGIKAQLYKEKGDSVANYQFLVDSIASHTHKEKKDLDNNKLTYAIDHAIITNVDLTWHDRNTDNGPKNLKLSALELNDEQSKKQHITITDLAYKTDNGKPRKNTGKPNRGAFDAGHLDLHINCDLTTNINSKDSINFSMNKMWGEDRGSGLIADSVSFTGVFSKDTVHLNTIYIKSKHTHLAFDKATIMLPDSTRELTYTTSTINGYTILSDISQPFAPVLKIFTTPLSLSVTLEGDKHGMLFHNIHVFTPDKRLKLQAEGDLTGLGHGNKKDINFKISGMTATGKIKDQIINHFKVKDSMKKLIVAAGDISYKGKLRVKEDPSKHVIITGDLNTRLGLIDFNVDIDQKQKYLTGNASSQEFEIGKLIDSKDFKDITFDAEFKFNIAGKKAAQELHRHLGKLPIGYIKGTAKSATYKKVTLHNLVWDITSDGDIAQGTAGMTGNLADLMCQFSFINTDFEKDLKWKPSVKFHSIIGKIKQKFSKDKSEKTDKD